MRPVITSLCFLWYLSSADTFSTLNPNKLTVEYLYKPQAVDSINPRLAWILQPVLTEDGALPKNLSQTAYQILVASKRDRLKVGFADLWETEKVQSDSTFGVRYRGKALKPGQSVFWTVRVWDHDDQVSGWAKVRKMINLYCCGLL